MEKGLASNSEKGEKIIKYITYNSRSGLLVGEELLQYYINKHFKETELESFLKELNIINFVNQEPLRF